MKPVAINTSAYHIGRAGMALQPVFDAAVVMPTILRPETARAIRSVFAQQGCGRVQLLVGIDKTDTARTMLEELGQEIPDNCLMSVFDLGYSTSERHGGVHQAHDGGSLRTALSFLANSPHIAYLDDDNWWADDHIATLKTAIEGKGWAFSLRWFVEESTGTPLAIDTWESVGPDKGAYHKHLGGWADPNTLMIDKTVCGAMLPQWAVPPKSDAEKLTADRNVFDALRTHFTWAATGKATCYYTIRESDPVHRYRMDWIAKQADKSARA